MPTTRIDPATVAGWGVDADPENDPTFPMRDRAQGGEHGLTWTRPAQQRSDVEILRSIEHNRTPAVFGTSTPPSGVSGEIRRQAFKFSESQWAHWLLLILADRINMVEGLAEDFAHARPPNLVKEYGLKAQWDHNRTKFVSRLAVAAGAGVVVGALLMTRGRRRGLRLR